MNRDGSSRSNPFYCCFVSIWETIVCERAEYLWERERQKKWGSEVLFWSEVTHVKVQLSSACDLVGCVVQSHTYKYPHFTAQSLPFCSVNGEWIWLWSNSHCRCVRTVTTETTIVSSGKTKNIYYNVINLWTLEHCSFAMYF